jgi:hypothetical protein
MIQSRLLLKALMSSVWSESRPCTISRHHPLLVFRWFLIALEKLVGVAMGSFKSASLPIPDSVTLSCETRSTVALRSALGSLAISLPE